MSSIDQVAQKFRSLRLSDIAEYLEPLLSQAEANESSYLHLHKAWLTMKKNNATVNVLNKTDGDLVFPYIKVWKNLTTAFRPPSTSVK